MTAENHQRRVVLGKISGMHGVKGWVKIFSYTDPHENILAYSPWLLLRKGRWSEFEVEDGRVQGKLIVAKLQDVDDRDTAASLMNAEIAVCRETLPATTENEFYWIDLEGLRVVDQDARELGVVDHLLATGANDVLVVKGKTETLIPFVQGSVIKRVDLDNGVINVQWDGEPES